MFKELRKVFESLEKIHENFKKNPNRTYTARHILRTSVLLKELKSKFNENLKSLVDAQVNQSSIESSKDKFLKLYNSIDAILTDKILLITKPGDTTREEFGEQLESEEESEEESGDFEDRNIGVHSLNMPIDKFKAFKLVPKLDSEGKDLNCFLNIVHEFDALSEDVNDKKGFIKFIIKSKIDSSLVRKLDLLEEISNSKDLERSLNKVLKPKRTTLQIQSDLVHEKQNNRKVKEFSAKIESLVAELSSVRISNVTDDNVKKMINSDVDETGLNAFKLGLNDFLKPVVYAANPATLAEAIQKAKDYESSISNGNNARVYRFNSNNYRGNNRQNRNNSNRYNNNFNNRPNNFRNNGNGRYNNNGGRFNNGNNNNNNNLRGQNYNRNNSSNNRGNRNSNNFNRNNNNNNYNNFNNAGNFQNNNRQNNGYGNRNGQNNRNNNNYRVNQVESENQMSPEAHNINASGNFQLN